ncbi:MAG TPA: arylamine N-acetyltransferase, partial [Rhizomicrobium sp.]|nr:arylamine N-acetyltransferase [Rhizomicrobium sp.]
MDLQAYLDRIGIREPVPSTLAGLRTLHRAHLIAIPYENLDVQLGRPVTTEVAPIYDKIVGRPQAEIERRRAAMRMIVHAPPLRIRLRQREGEAAIAEVAGHNVNGFDRPITK